MKTDTNKQNQTYEIRQNGKTVLRSDCEFSLPMIFNNLTGRNFAKKSEYHDYIRFIAIKEMGFTYGEIELVKNGEVVVKGHIIEEIKSGRQKPPFKPFINQKQTKLWEHGDQESTKTILRGII